MKKLISLALIVALTSSAFLTGCTANNTTNNTAAMQQQLKTLQDENTRLQQENTDLTQFRDRVAVDLSNMDQILYNLKRQGYLPFVGLTAKDPQLADAMQAIRKITIQIQGSEIVLSMMPREWSPDFTSILVVYDIFSPAPDAAKGNPGTITTMAGIYKNTNGTWQQVKFTRAYKGDGSFTLKNI